MDSKKLNELLEKYWACESSLEEEQQLHEYFRTNTVPGYLKETAELFHYFDENKKKSVDDLAFDEEVLEKVKSGTSTETPKKSKMVRLVYNSMRIAAGVTVVMVATWFIRTEIRKTTPQAMVDTYDDPKLAFEETKKALLMISKSFGRAETETKKIDLFNKATDEVKKKETTQL
jgi:hypothetical protein